MPTVIFIHPNDRREAILASDGDSAMFAALSHGIEGIIAECGGGAVCATCHVYVEDGWVEKLPPLALDQDDLLEGVAADRQPNSRLSCQIKLNADLDGIVLRIPERQV